MTELVWVVVAVVVLVIACLVVREQTEKWLRSLALEVRALRTRDKRLSESRADIDKIGNQLREVSLRVDRRQYQLDEVADRFEQGLQELHLALRDQEMPSGVARPKPATDDEQLDEPTGA